MSKLATSLKVVDARPEHAAHILKELSAHSEWDGARSLDQFEKELGLSLFAHVALYDETPVAVWGVQQHHLLENDGYLWLVTTKFVEERPFLFIRYGQLILENIERHFNYLHCTLKVGEKANAKWLSLLGFSPRPPIEYNGTRYARYIRRRA